MQKKRSKTETKLFGVLSIDETKAMRASLNNHTFQYEVCLAVAVQIKIEVPVSCYVSGGLLPTTENRMHAEKIFIRSSLSHASDQSLVVSKTFHRFKSRKHYMVIVKIGETASRQDTTVW